MSETEKNIVEIQSEEFQEIIGGVPHWLLRSGMTVLFLIVVMISVISWLIKYPDVVNTSFRLTSVNAPKAILSKSDGKLVGLFVKEDEFVKKDQILAFLESPSDHEAVLQLERELGTLEREVADKHFDLHLSRYIKLGEIQSEYHIFNLKFIEYLAFQKNGFYAKKRSMLLKEIKNLKLQKNVLMQQKLINEADWALAQEELTVQKKLFDEKVISTLDFKREQSRLLAKQLPLKSTETSVLGNEAAQAAKIGEILEIDKSVSEQENIILQALYALKSAIDVWKIKYVLYAPFDGHVFFSTTLELNQNVRSGDELFFISPDSKDFLGEILIPQQNFGKVKLDQNVIIKFNAYPFQEYGFLRGRIIFISQIPIQDSVFMAKVQLTDGLITNYGRNLVYKTGMRATGEVITDDKRLAERIFYNFRKALDTSQ